MTKKTPYLANGISYSITKKRFEMMVKKSSKSTKAFKLSAVLPLLCAVLFMYCADVAERSETELGLVEFNGSFVIDHHDRIYSNVKLFWDTSNHYDIERRFIDEQGEFFSGTQSWKLKNNDKLKQSILFEEGRSVKVLNYHDDGSELRRDEFVIGEESTRIDLFFEGEYAGMAEAWYEDNGRIRKSRNEDVNGKEGSHSVHELDENNQLIDAKVFVEETLMLHAYLDGEYTIQKEYFDNGKLKKEIRRPSGLRGIFSDVAGPMKNATIVDYDQSGKVIKKVSYKNGKEIVESI